MKQVNAKSPRYSAEEWEAHKADVERLYVIEDRPLKEVINTLYQEFGFIARFFLSHLHI
jgi:hypothetical protein